MNTEKRGWIRSSELVEKEGCDHDMDIYYSSTCNNSINNTRLVNINVKNININIYVKKIGKHRAALLCSHCFMRHRTHHSLTAKVKIKCNESVKQR